MADVVDFIERFYNPTRRHSTLGYLSHMDFERQAQVAYYCGRQQHGTADSYSLAVALVTTDTNSSIF